MTRAQIAELVAEHYPAQDTDAELEAAAEALAVRLPTTPWLIEERESAHSGGRPTHHGTVVCNTRFARAKLGLANPPVA